MITPQERAIVETIKANKRIRIEYYDSNGLVHGLVVSGRVPHEIGLSIQNHFNNLDKR